jgi:hypothetical protein
MAIAVMVYQEKDAKGQCVHTMTQTEDVGFFVDVNQPVNDVRLSPNKRWILLVGDEHYATAALVDYRIGPESNPNVTALENEEVIVMDDSEDSDSDPNEEWSDITEEETYEPCDMYLATRWDIDYWFELREQIQVFESDVHGVLANMQYVTWNCDSSLAAISCDTHPCIFIVGFPTEQDLKRNPKASPKALKTVRVSGTDDWVIDCRRTDLCHQFSSSESQCISRSIDGYSKCTYDYFNRIFMDLRES